MKSKTRINKQIQKKTNSELVETILVAKKKDAWNAVSGFLSGPRRKSIVLNLSEINELSKDGESIIVPGKVLSQGEIDKKIRIIALNFSEKTKKKLSKTKVQISTILEEIKKNPEFKGLRILRK